MIEIRELQILSVCADEGSFSRAADTLYTSQPNISKVIHGLEEKLGFPVFERNGRGISLTPKGKIIYERGQRILEEAEKLSDLYQIDSREEMSCCSMPSSWISDCFRQYYQAMQGANLRFRFIEGSLNTVLKRVGEGHDEIGFVAFLENDLPRIRYKMKHQGLAFEKLRESYAVIYRGNQRKESLGSGAAGEEKINLVQCYEDEFALNHFWDDNGQFKSLPLHYQVDVITNSDYVMRNLLENTDICNISYEDLANRARFQKLASHEFTQKVIFGYVYSENKALKQRTKDLVDIIKRNMARR